MLPSSWNLEIQNVFYTSSKATFLLLDAVNTVEFFCGAWNALFVQDDSFKIESTTQNNTSLDKIARVHKVRSKTGEETSLSVAAGYRHKQLAQVNLEASAGGEEAAQPKLYMASEWMWPLSSCPSGAAITSHTVAVAKLRRPL